MALVLTTGVGLIVAVCTSAVSGVPKYPQPTAVLAEFGLQGDYHCKPMRQSFSKRGTEKPNIDRHITIVAQEALDFANEELGTALKAGDLGENITTHGLGDLSGIPADAAVYINDKKLLEVVEQNQPCIVLKPYHKRLGKVIYGKRGLLCRVIAEQIGTVIRPGDRIEIGW